MAALRLEKKERLSMLSRPEGSWTRGSWAGAKQTVMAVNGGDPGALAKCRTHQLSVPIALVTGGLVKLAADRIRGYTVVH